MKSDEILGKLEDVQETITRLQKELGGSSSRQFSNALKKRDKLLTAYEIAIVIENPLPVEATPEEDTKIKHVLSMRASAEEVEDYDEEKFLTENFWPIMYKVEPRRIVFEKLLAQAEEATIYEDREVYTNALFKNAELAYLKGDYEKGKIFKMIASRL